MPTKLEEATPYKKNTEIRATRDLENVPKGTHGKVKTTAGLTWLRYWVAFDNGVWMGSVDHDDVVPADDWDDYFRRKEEQEKAVAEQAAKPAAAEAAAGDGGAAGGPASKVPAHLLERSKRAREKKAGAGG